MMAPSIFLLVLKFLELSFAYSQYGVVFLYTQSMVPAVLHERYIRY
jgi:hypothetical protein